MQWPWNSAQFSKPHPSITTIDAHTAGEPLRIITGGLPEIPGETMLERRRWFLANLDHIRQALMFEPRGHRDMYGCVVTPPVSDEADLGVLFMHNEGYSTMCGHGIIALVTALFKTGALPEKGKETPIAIDTPAGLVRATAHIHGNDCVSRVSFLNVPSFVYRQGMQIDVDEFGAVEVDIAFGGAFYAILAADALHSKIESRNLRQLVSAADAIKRSINDAIEIEHPSDADLGFLYGVILTGPPEEASHHSRNICVFADSEVDRSPTGTGVSARLAVHHAKGEIELNERIVIESILGQTSTFSGRVVETTKVGPHRAIVPEISGQASITGHHEFVLTADDPIGKGFHL